MMSTEEKKNTQPEQSGQKEHFLVSAPGVSLPKGGGAIRGMGEKFAANPVTGTASLSVPIFTSPGRSGFGPQLSLSYDSGCGNGPFGIGWSLSLPQITRKTDRGLPRYRDGQGDQPDSDVFILSGVEDLVPEFEKDDRGRWVTKNGKPVIYEKFRSIGGFTYAIRRYRPRTEGMFARIERWTSQSFPTDVRWRSISRDNVTSWYGTSPETRIADPENAAHIFTWLISESYDDKGNAIRYGYRQENGEGVDLTRANERNRARTANHYIKSIKYANRTPRTTNEDLSGRDDWLFEVVFDYGEHNKEKPAPNDSGEWLCRHDPFSVYRSGFEVRTYRLCQRVLMFHHFGEEPGVGTNCLVRSTDLAYRDLRHNPDDVKKGHPLGAFLASATQSGYRGDEVRGYLKKCLPPVECEYTEAVIDQTIRQVDAASLENLPSGLDGSRYQWVDLDGEGLSGILTEQAGAWFYKRNSSANNITRHNETGRCAPRFEPLELVAAQPNIALSTGQAQPVDLAGNGQLDLAAFGGAVAGFYERTGEGGWASFRSFSSLPNVAWNDPNLRFVDLTGDGRADVLITEDSVFTWYPSLGEEGFERSGSTVQADDEERAPHLVFADGTQSVYLGDLSGDGLSDLLRIRNGEVCYWPNLGYGRFGARVTMDNSPWFDAPDLFDQKRIRLADIDGSGTTDIIYLSARGVAIYRNESGNAFADPEYLEGFPPIDDVSSVVVTDLLGNGTACLVWSSPLPGNARNSMSYLDLMGGVKPHLLKKAWNNLGAETEVTYAPSTRFYLQDRQDGKPWITRLPFPVHCVEKVKVTDRWRLTQFTTTYSYHHGYFDGVEREFRGFGRVEQVDTESFGKFLSATEESPYVTDDRTLLQAPVKTVTWYHTGAFIDRQKILSHFREEYFPNWFEASRPGEINAPGDFKENVLPEPDVEAEGATLSPDEWREALRACRGMMLRQEVYELDVDAVEHDEQRRVKLFSAACHNAHVRLLQPAANNSHAVFRVGESEAITYHYELDLTATPVKPDPRIAHTLNLRMDEYGNVEQSVAVVYRRIGEYSDPLLTDDQNGLIKQVQQEMHLSYSEHHYTDDVSDADNRRLRVVSEAMTYELTGISPEGDDTRTEEPRGNLYFQVDELRAYRLSDTLPDQGSRAVGKLEYHEIADGKTPQKRLLEHACTLFFADDPTDKANFLINPLAPGKLGRLGLPYEHYRLALTEKLLEAVFTDGQLDRPVPGGGALPQTLRERLDQPRISGYVRGTDAFERLGEAARGHYWIRSGVAGFAEDAARHFFLPERYTDPFGNVTILRHDGKYGLYVESSTDAAGNMVSVKQFDFRVLQPGSMRDLNDNLSEVCFDALGMPTAMAVRGKGEEADDLGGFDDDLVDPDADVLMAFFTGTYSERDARRFLDRGTARFLYYFGEQREPEGATTWLTRPPCACSILREKHARCDGGGETAVQSAFEHSDGSGTVLVKKSQAEPAEGNTDQRWIATGKIIFNNKGKPVKQYEPYFSPTHQFGEPVEAGVTPLMYYDAPGRLIRTELPDGSFSRVQFSPWHVENWDPNDTVLESKWYADRDSPSPELSIPAEPEARAAWLTAQHAGTASVTILDTLGREVIAVSHNRVKDPEGTHTFNGEKFKDEKYVTFSKLDAEGKPLWLRDARWNLAMQYVYPVKPDSDTGNEVPAGSATCYDVAGNLLFQHSMDAGDRWMLADAAGKPMYRWEENSSCDENGDETNEKRTYLTVYDCLHRPVEQWLSIDDEKGRLIEHFLYGEEIADAADGRRNNMRGQLYRHYDQSGLKSIERYDFKGNPLEVQQRLTSRYGESIVDWQADAEGKLEEKDEGTYIQITEYDALNRMTRLFNWHKGPGGRVAVYEPTYNRRGVLETEQLVVRAIKKDIKDNAKGYEEDTESRRITPLESISYNAKGQRESIGYGNGTRTRYRYDPLTFRLIHLRTTRTGQDPTVPGSPAPLDDDRVVQDLYYTYDPVGNIEEITDRAYETAFFKNQKVEPRNHYAYDALYRLVSSTGREDYLAGGAQGQFEPGPHGVLFPLDYPKDPRALRNFSQFYRYDPAGNIREIRHAADGGGWTSTYDYADHSNRLSRTWLGDDKVKAIQYRHDRRGNMRNLSNVEARYFMQWDDRDMLCRLNLGGGGWAYYNYNADKQRTRKVIESRDGVKQWERLYLGGLEIYREYSGGALVEEIETVQLVDGDRRVLLVEDVRQTNNGRLKPGVLYRYQYGNHVGSAVLELDDQAAIISYEEYHPYGTTAYRAVNKAIRAAAKRYRYTGKERDEESGLYYHGVRYYASWLGRWISGDPGGTVDGANLYNYCRLSPVKNSDSQGFQTGASPFLDADIYRKLDTLQGYTREHLLPGKQWYWSLVQEYGQSSVDNIYDRVYANMQAVQTPNTICGPKTTGDNALTTILRKDALNLQKDPLKHKKTDLRYWYLRNKQNWIESTFKGTGTKITPADIERLEKIAIKQSTPAFRAEVLLREEKAGTPIPVRLAKKLNPKPVSTTAGVSKASPVNVINFPKPVQTAATVSEEAKTVTTTMKLGAAALRAGEFLGAAAKVVGGAFTVYGAYNQAEKTYAATGDSFGAADAFLLSIPAGLVDDAIFATGVGAPLVLDSWKANDSGPVQNLAGEAMRWLGKAFSGNLFQIERSNQSWSS